MAGEHIDALVIGAGVVGLACARALAQAGREVLVLEAAEGIGTGTSSRNSEVIHAGIYYAAGSLKAALCVQGRHLLYAYCRERSIPHSNCGKLIVASRPGQLAQLQGIAAKAACNGVDDLQILTRAQALGLEPALDCVGALLSPSTGVLDSHAFMLSLQGDLENAGGMAVCNTAVSHICLPQGPADRSFIEVSTSDGMQLRARAVVNAAGLHAVDVAVRMQGLPPEHLPSAYYCKGNYYTLTGRSPFTRLIYPVPEAAGLGVHLTLDLGGQAKFGPDVEWVESPNDLTVDPRRSELFYEAVRTYWPALPDGALQPGYSGIRPKISGPAEPAADFRIDGPAAHGVPGLVNLFGIESPGLTSALAIAEHVSALLR
jgi:L-2-hydroxyglutarate oxidase LhgO